MTKYTRLLYGHLSPDVFIHDITFTPFLTKGGYTSLDTSPPHDEFSKICGIVFFFYFE